MSGLPPGLAGYLAAVNQNQQAQGAELQQAVQLQGLRAQLQKQAQEQQFRASMAGAGGDIEKALSVALSTGNVEAAHQLAPLVKMQQEARQREETPRLLAQITGQGAPGASAGATEVGIGQPVSVAGGAPQQQADPRQARIAQLQQMTLIPQVANNPVVMQRLQAEIDRLSSVKPMIEHNFSVGNEQVQPHISHDEGRTWQPIPGSQPSAKFARQVAPVVNVKPAASEAPAGLSTQYANDPTYKRNVDYWANFLKDGGTLPPRFAQSGAGKKMMPDILNVVPTLGGTGKDLLANQVDLTGQKSEARAVGTRAAAVEMAAGEAREMMPILLATSENFKRTGYQPINRVLKSYQDNTGSVESRQFGAALNTFINVYARAISPSGVPTVSDKDHAREVLSTADSHEQLVGLLKVLDQEMVAAQNAPARVRAAQREGITGTAAPGHSDGWSIKKK